MKPRWIDFHCHLDLYREHVALIRACEHEQIATLAITTTPKAWQRNRELAGQFVRPALGLHPQLISERASEFALWEKLLPETRLVGEVGLDAGPKFYSSFDQQKAVFARILRACAEAGNKVLSVHSARCAATVIEMLQANLPPDRGTVVLHWFTGTKAEAEKAVALNCFFSVNSAMAKSVRGRELMAALPLERILTETDGPFVEVQGKPAKPTDIPDVVATLARERHLTTTDMAERIVKNWARVVGDAAAWARS